MGMTQANLYATYKNNQIQTAGPGDLLLLLYDRAVLLTRQAGRAIAAGNPAEAHRCLMRTQDIVSELMATLNFEAGEVAGQLFSLYEYMKFRLTEANIRKDAAAVAEVGGMLSELREAWVQAVRGSRKN